MMEGKEFDSFMHFKTFLDQYSKENNTIYCIADSRTAQYSNKRLPKNPAEWPIIPQWGHFMAGRTVQYPADFGRIVRLDRISGASLVIVHTN